MNAREPSDAEIDAAFNDIVARFTRGESGTDDSWAAQHPLFAEPDADADDDANGGPHQGGAHDGGSQGRSRTERRSPPDDNSRPDDFLVDDPPLGDAGPDDDGPTLRGEVLDPLTASDEDDDRDEQPLGWRVHHPPDDDELDELDLDELPRTPLPPWRPSSAAMAALVLIVGSTVVTLLLIAEVRLPWWSGWAALVSFLAGMGLLFTRMPRDRDEDSDDGAVV